MTNGTNNWVDTYEARVQTHTTDSTRHADTNNNLRKPYNSV